MCEFCTKVFSVTLLGFLFLISTLVYVGVMITYIAIPVIVVCGFLSKWGNCIDKKINIEENFTKINADKITKTLNKLVD